MFTLCFIGLIAAAQITQAIPRAAVENPSFNFGTVEEGEMIIHDFVIKNTGGDDLMIMSIYTG